MSTLPPARRGERGDRALLRARLLRAGLWFLVVSGPVAAVLLGWQVTVLRAELSAAANVAPAPVVDTSLAEGLAELFVASWLSGDDTSPLFLDGIPSDSRKKVGRWRASETVSLGSDLEGSQAAVAVAVELESWDQRRGWRPAGTHFYRVALAETATGWAVAGPPALVAAPALTGRPDQLVSMSGGLAQLPGLEETVTGFLRALIIGEGELDRYVAPGSRIVAVTPPPFARVGVITSRFAAEDDGSLLVRVLVEGLDQARRMQVVEYWLRAVDREGRFEIAEVLPGAPLESMEVDG